MLASLSFSGKRELLARALYWTGTSHIISQLPARDSLLVLNYHRIGNAADDLFDPGVFSATADALDEQIKYLKRRVSIVTLEEALAFSGGSDTHKARRCCVLLTFDDGYLDNFQIAFPILRSHGVQGVFFLATGMVGSCHVPWWDHIAFVVKTARKRQFSLRYPARLVIDLDENGVEASLRAILGLYKKPENSDPHRFIRELEREAKGEDLPGTVRRFLDWDEAREMLRGGMAIGSHTHSHHVLSQLEPDLQLEEMRNSRCILKENLGVDIDVIAYPVGSKTSFNEHTRNAARAAGYRVAFSFYGGINVPGKVSPYDLNRIGIGDQSRSRFRVQTSVCRFAGAFWP